VVGASQHPGLGQAVIIITGNAERLIGHDERHCARNARLSGTLMRHFLRAPCTPGTLTSRMPACSAVALLIACPGSQERLTPPNPCTPPHAIAVAPIAAQTQAHLRATAHSAIEPIRVRFCLHRARRVSRWTTPRNQGIKARHAREQARALWKARGSVQERARAFVFAAFALSITHAVQLAPSTRSDPTDVSV